MAGVTTVRDLGDRGFLGVRIKEMTSADPLLGADVVPAGPPLTSPQGHCWSLGGVVEESGIRAAVREHARSGADVIKVMVTGGEMTPGTDPTTCQFSLAALEAAADEAHRQGLMITGHAHGAAGILAAVEAGFDGIEHASFATPDGPTADPAVIEQLAASNITVTVLAGLKAGTVIPEPVARHIEMSQHVRSHTAAFPTVPDLPSGAVPGSRRVRREAPPRREAASASWSCRPGRAMRAPVVSACGAASTAVLRRDPHLKEAVPVPTYPRRVHRRRSGRSHDVSARRRRLSRSGAPCCSSCGTAR